MLTVSFKRLFHGRYTPVERAKPGQIN